MKLQRKFKKTLRRLNFLDNHIHTKKAVIWDKTCPKCNSFVYGNPDFCTCGFSVTKEKIIKLWSVIIFTWCFIFVFVLFSLSNLSQLHSLVYKKLEKNNSDFYSLSPAGIQVITSLRNTKYRDCIQSIYVDPREKNKLMVLIKPVYWEMLPDGEKELLKQMIIKKWDEIYKNTSPFSKLKPEVILANS